MSGRVNEVWTIYRFAPPTVFLPSMAMVQRVLSDCGGVLLAEDSLILPLLAPKTQGGGGAFCPYTVRLNIHSLPQSKTNSPKRTDA
jgi:hypothetical protein